MKSSRARDRSRISLQDDGEICSGWLKGTINKRVASYLVRLKGKRTHRLEELDKLSVEVNMSMAQIHFDLFAKFDG